MIQKKIHKGFLQLWTELLQETDRVPLYGSHVKNVLLASADQVAIDAVAAKLMGFDPLKDCKYIRLAHDAGLGCGDVRQIEIVGDVDALNENWNFVGPIKNDLCKQMPAPDLLGPLKKPVEWTLKTILAPGPTLPVLFIMICTGIRKTMAGSRKF